ncbi:MAG: phenylalanine--tRNA ligase subunit beta [Flavobacterium sp.]
MRISYNWIKQFLKLDKPSNEIAEILTDLGLEVEGIEPYESIKGGLKGVVVGEVITCEKHPDADRLKVTTVDIGNGTILPIVCGAPNVTAGQKVPVATIGTKVFDKEGQSFEIKKGKIRGQESHGMICAEDELGLGNNHDGIMVLDADLTVGTPLSEVLEVENDEVFEIGLTPNRADAMSHWGVARDLRAGLLQRNSATELITPSVTNFRVDKRTLKIDVDVVDAKLAPRYCGLTISGVNVKPSPQWLQNRLKAIGLTPKNNIVDVTNYVLHELGQPLHAFDAAKISGKIIVKTVPADTKFTTLDEVERTLHEEDLMICDEKGPLCIAGVFGGKESGVTEHTQSIFLESAYFNPVSIRKSAKRHGLSTDASFRFERGIDPNITEYALKRAALLIKEVSGGEITSDIIDVYPKRIEDFPVLLNYEKVNKIIGQEIPRETIKKILVSLDIKVNSVSDAGLGLTIPSYRVDVQREIDVIEEILRVYGYNQIGFSKKVNASMSNASRTEDYKVQNIIAELLNAQGFHEMMANSLTAPDKVDAVSGEHSQVVQMLNPLSNDLSVMRNDMLYSALEAVSYNLNRKNLRLKFFEYGKTYHNIDNTYQEYKHLTLTMTGAKQAEFWSSASKPSDFFQFKGYIIQILERLGISSYRHEPLQHKNVAEGVSLTLQNKVLVTFGTVSKKLIKQFDIKQEVFFADFNWDLVLSTLQNKLKFKEIPKYPEVRRDFALLLDETVSFQSLFEIAKQTEKQLLTDVNLFDVYQGNQLPEGKKSYALSFTLQDTNKTLTDEQIDKVMKKLLSAFEKEFQASLR